MALSDYFSTPVNKSTGKPFTTKEVSDAFAAKQDVSASKKKSVAAGEATGGAYVYKGKGAAHKGEYRVNYSSAVKAEAKELGVDIQASGWQGNRSSVAASAQKFNDEMEAARNEKAEAEASAADDATTDTTGTTDAFDINVGDEVVEAADPSDFNIDAEVAAPIEADNTAATFDDVVAGPGNAMDTSATNTLMTGTFDDDYVAGTGETSAASAVVDQALATENSTGAAEDEAIGDYGSGTRGTIMTSPQGLLDDESDVFSTANDDEGFLRQQRSLGGGLIY